MESFFYPAKAGTIQAAGSLALWLARQQKAWDQYTAENPDAVLRKPGKAKEVTVLPDSCGADPSEGYETEEIGRQFRLLCSLAENTGKGEYGDCAEKLIYNALPGAMMSDGSGVQQISAMNQTVSDAFSHPDGPLRQYRMDPVAAGKLFGVLPDFVQHLWMTQADFSPAAVLYAPSRFIGKNYVISEETGYPFDETILFRWEEVPGKIMPFTFRIPGWCTVPEIRLNGEKQALKAKTGKFLTLRRLWKKGDVLELTLPMECIQKYERFCSRVERGPLLYALPLELRSSRTGKGKFAPWNLSTPELWNWGMAPGAHFRVLKPETGCPDLWTEPPVLIRAPLFPVRGFDALEQGRYTPPLPLFSGPAGAEREKTLIPYGCTPLRIAAFPDGQKRELVYCTEVSRRKTEILFCLQGTHPGKVRFCLTVKGKTEGFLNGKPIFEGKNSGCFTGRLRKEKNMFLLKVRKPEQIPSVKLSAFYE